jgi:hypothetical protein
VPGAVVRCIKSYAAQIHGVNYVRVGEMQGGAKRSVLVEGTSTEVRVCVHPLEVCCELVALDRGVQL